MATNFIYNRVNSLGIPCIESKSITESTTSVTFNFSTSPATNSRFSGLIAIRISEQAGSTADTLPVYFNVPSVAGTNMPLTTFSGTVVTGVEVQEGIHLVFYDRENGIMQLLI